MLWIIGFVSSDLVPPVKRYIISTSQTKRTDKISTTRLPAASVSFVLFVPAKTTFPDLKTSAVHLGSRIRMIMASNRLTVSSIFQTYTLGLYSVLRNLSTTSGKLISFFIFIVETILLGIMMSKNTLLDSPLRYYDRILFWIIITNSTVPVREHWHIAGSSKRVHKQYMK